MVSNFEVKEESDYKEAGGESIKVIILRQIRKIGDICCQEFTGGYWEKKPVKTADGIMFSEVYHNDVREAYCNAVDFLIDIIYPFGDKVLKSYLKSNEGFDKDADKNKDDDDDDDNEGNKNKDTSKTEEEVKIKLKKKKKSFRKINLMFERTDFWQGTSDYTE